MPITQSSFCSPSRTTQAYRESMNSRNPRARVKQPLRRSKTMMIGLHSHYQPLLSHLSSPLFISPSPRTHPTPLTILATQVSHLTAAALAAPISSDSGLLFREKLLYLQSINVNPQKALRQNPNFRSSPLSSLQSVESCLASFGIPRSSLGRILDMFPQLLTSDPHSDLYPVFDFLLNEVHIPFPDLHKSISRCPRILVSSVDAQLRPALAFLRGIGFVGSHAIDAHTSLLLVSSVEHTLLPKMEYLRSLGFEREEVAWMVVRSPGLLTMSIENNLKPKAEFFLRDMQGDLAELKRFPQFFSFSLERKIKPRHRMLVELRLELRLPDMLKVSDGEFNARLIEMRLWRVEAVDG